MSKMTDYGTMALGHLASQLQRDADRPASLSANDIAATTGLPAPTVSKVLKAFARAKIVVSQRGANGGYTLARNAEDISATEILHALAEPMSLTTCSSSDHNCNLADQCSVTHSWQRINQVIHDALAKVSLADLIDAQRPGVQTFSLGELTNKPNNSNLSA
ncbi:MAG: SUF system Fe-S cluster assembly regulator [Gammaproteobacteria bacterium]|nr:SUF system Fe-S cluster assembly regulator [Gammaproteobacteria bacterium]